MATDFFIKIDGIEGESTDEKHAKEIELTGWSFGVTNQGTMASGGGGGSGKAEFSDITIRKRVDRSTPKMLKAAASGDHIPKIVLVSRKAGGKGGQVDYLTVSLGDVFISGYQSDAGIGGDSIPQESIKLNYATIKYEYKPQKPDGSLEGSVTAGYDRHLNKFS